VGRERGTRHCGGRGYDVISPLAVSLSVGGELVIGSDFDLVAVSVGRKADGQLSNCSYS
jgi:hypothetical protein